MFGSEAATPRSSVIAPVSAEEDREWLPAILLGLLQGLTFVRKYGLVFILLLALTALLRRGAAPAPSRPLLALCLAGIAATVGALLLSPEADLEHELQSRYDRLLLHWLGVSCVLLGPWCARLTRAD